MRALILILAFFCNAVAFADDRKLSDSVGVVRCGNYYGTGFYLGDRLAMTAAHVIGSAKDCRFCTVQFGNATIECSVLEIDSETDHCVLEMTSDPGESCLPLSVAAIEPNEIGHGRLIRAIGFDSGKSLREWGGKYIAKMWPSARPRKVSLIFQGECREGDSGGPAFNQRGDVIGIVILRDCTDGVPVTHITQLSDVVAIVELATKKRKLR